MARGASERGGAAACRIFSNNPRSSGSRSPFADSRYDRALNSRSSATYLNRLRAPSTTSDRPIARAPQLASPSQLPDTGKVETGPGYAFCGCALRDHLPSPVRDADLHELFPGQVERQMPPTNVTLSLSLRIPRNPIGRAVLALSRLPAPRPDLKGFPAAK